MRKMGGIILLLGLGLTAGARLSHAQPKQLFAFACQERSGGGAACPDGAFPETILQAPGGTIFGAANVSGSANAGGIIFSLAPGKFTVLHDFASPAGVYPHGNQPGAALILGKDGSLYGTTTSGGTYNGGVIFRLSTTGTEFAVLYDFCSLANCADGQQPNALVQGIDGNLYGTTWSGGIASGSCFGTGCGTVFRFSLATRSFTSLHSFDPAQDGAQPYGLIQASDGNFYGTDCGASDGAGCASGSSPGYLFRVTGAGHYSMISTLPDLPLTGLAEGTGGVLYGVVLGSCGSEVYQVNLDGSEFKESGVCFTTWGARTPIYAADGSLWLTPGDSSTAQSIECPRRVSCLRLACLTAPMGRHPGVL